MLPLLLLLLWASMACLSRNRVRNGQLPSESKQAFTAANGLNGLIHLADDERTQNNMQTRVLEYACQTVTE